MSSPFKLAVLTALMMSFVMSLFFAGLFTFVALGPTPEWLTAWAKGLGLGWPLGFALAMLIGQPVRALALRLSGGPGKG
jgi:hypothetical protein